MLILSGFEKSQWSSEAHPGQSYTVSNSVFFKKLASFENPDREKAMCTKAAQASILL